MGNKIFILLFFKIIHIFKILKKMKFHYFFLFKISIILLISLSIEKEFNPIPQENGKLNAEYNHQQNEKNLFFIFLNFRHGARAPIFLINDTTDMLGGKWLIKSELTNLGKIQHYEIGLKNKKRYSDFISNDYDPKEILIYSTYFDRAILSAESQLLGLYDNITYPYFNYSDINNNDIININKIIPPIFRPRLSALPRVSVQALHCSTSS